MNHISIAILLILLVWSVSAITWVFMAASSTKDWPRCGDPTDGENHEPSNMENK